MTSTSRIYELVKALKVNNLQYAGQKELYEYCSGIALAVIKKKYFDSLSNIHASTGYDQFDLATDSVIPLFLKTKGTNNISLKIALNCWHNGVEDESQALYFINKVVWNRVAQYMCEMFKMSDPCFAKMLKTVNYFIRKNGYLKRGHFGKIYVLESELESLAGLISEEKFCFIPYEVFEEDPGNSMRQLFRYLKTETSFSPAIPLNTFIKRMNDLRESTSFGMATEDVILEDNIIMEETMRSCENLVYGKLEEFYMRKGKLTEAEGLVIRRVIGDIARDFMDGGASGGLYEYMRSHMPDLDKNTFYGKYHQILDHLIRILKKNIKEELIA